MGPDAHKDSISEVHNMSHDVPAANVVVTDLPSPHLRITASDPPGEPGEGGVFHWRLGVLHPGETKAIKVTGVCDTAGHVENCATVAFEPMVCVVTDSTSRCWRSRRRAASSSTSARTSPMRSR